MKSISIVIPAYNEVNRIGKCLTSVINYVEGKYDYEIIVVDDGSRDSTARIVEGFMNPHIILITNEKNKGKGYSVKKGVLAAKKPWILFTDADVSTPIKELGKLMSQEGFDVAIGSRAMAQSNIVVSQPFYRGLGGKVFNIIVRAMRLSSFKDTQCGFKLFKKEAARKIFERQRINGFAFDVEVLYIAKKLGLTVKECPVDWYNSKETKVKFIRSSLSMFSDLVKIRFNDRKGIYRGA